MKKNLNRRFKINLAKKIENIDKLPNSSMIYQTIFQKIYRTQNRENLTINNYGAIFDLNDISDELLWK